MGKYDEKSNSKKILPRGSFITIDDLIVKSQELFIGLRKLGKSKHPLDIRRGIGRREVKNMTDQDSRSRTLKAGSKTYFFDIKETKDGKSYLIITESRFKGENEDRERSAVVVFPEKAKDFAEIVTEMAANLG